MSREFPKTKPARYRCQESEPCIRRNAGSARGEPAGDGPCSRQWAQGRVPIPVKWSPCRTRLSRRQHATVRFVHRESLTRAAPSHPKPPSGTPASPLAAPTYACCWRSSAPTSSQQPPAGNISSIHPPHSLHFPHSDSNSALPVDLAVSNFPTTKHSFREISHRTRLPDARILPGDQPSINSIHPRKCCKNKSVPS